MEEQKTVEEKKDKKGKGGLFIPAGLFIGFGVGLLVDNVAAGMFLGLGIGFLFFAFSFFIKE
ncbi:MAG: hypothetical protein WC514_01405 [Candidatus Paceibacterota bacterium]